MQIKPGAKRARTGRCFLGLLAEPFSVIPRSPLEGILVIASQIFRIRSVGLFSGSLKGKRGTWQNL